MFADMLGTPLLFQSTGNRVLGFIIPGFEVHLTTKIKQTEK